MLKHVSYRSSSTSLSRPFGNNCRGGANSTLNPADKSRLSNASIVSSVVSPISAPNSPKISQYPRHTRNHSLVPTSSATDKFQTSTDETDCCPSIRPGASLRVVPDSARLLVPSHRHTNSQSNTLMNKSRSLPMRPCHEESTNNSQTSLINHNQNSKEAEHKVTLKSDDPLSRHQNELRSVESMTLRGELMPESSSASHCDSSDSISLHSAVSMTSLCRNDLRASSTSLCTSKVPVRIHLRQLRPDIEYKTLRLDTEMSCRQLIEHLLQKLRLKHRDPNLFAVVLEAAVRGPGGAPSVRKRFLLEDSARPVELQQCRPRGEANFSITMRRGGVLKVSDSVLTPGSQYKSILVSYTSNVVEVIQLLLRCNNRSDNWQMFTLHEVCSEPYNDRMLNDSDKPLLVQNSWPKNDRNKYSLVMRRHLTQGIMQGQVSWRRLSIDECCIDVDVEMDEHNSTCSSILTTSSHGSRSRCSISSTTASVLSLASLSSNSSSRCSFSSGSSSSGVSSGSSSSSSSYSPTDTPEKDRKIHNIQKRQLPPIPLTPSALIKKYPISVEENIQSYFSLPSDDDMNSPAKQRSKTDVETAATPPRPAKRPPQPLPRRVLNLPPVNASIQSDDSGVFEADIFEGKELNENFHKTWSVSPSCYSPTGWIKARGPAAQTWQNRSRSARIRSATISTPVEHMANNSLYCSRSKSSDQSRLSTITLTSQPSTPTPTTPTSYKSIFTFNQPSMMSRAQSTSSINNNNNLNSVCHYKSYHEAVIGPLSSKLRPLSLAPNSSIAFPARPTSLVSSAHSQSTTTLKASSSSLSLLATTPSPDSNATSLAKSLTSTIKSKSVSSGISVALTPAVIPEQIITNSNSSQQKQISPVKSQINNIDILLTNTKIPIETNNNDCHHEKSHVKVQSNAPETNNYKVSSTNGNDKLLDNKMHSHISNTTEHDDSKHCQSCCRYDNCFYI